jgi:uncharacterized protein (DUF4415 family)
MLFEWDENPHGENRIVAVGVMLVGGGSFQQGGHIAMKGGTTRTTSESRAKGETDFKRLREMRDRDIDDSDIPKLDKAFWEAAKLTMPQPKDRLTIRLDHDLVEWLKQRGSGYQTRINAILRSYMNAQSGARR